MCVSEINYHQPPKEAIDVEDRVTVSTNVENDDRHPSSSKSATIAKDAAAEDNQHIFKSLSSTNQFALLSISMIILFSVHNVLQEAIMKLPNFKYGVMLGYMEVLGVTVCSYLERKYMTKEIGHVAPLSQYTLLTACLLASSALSSMSLNYINFPTKVVFRSCKLLPAMLISTIINRRVFSSNEYTCAFAISTGLILFAAADWKLTPSFNSWGISLVSLSVVADAILPNAQERLFKLGSSRLEVTMYTNFFTLIAMTFTTILSGDFVAVLKLATSSNELACYLAVYTLISYAAISTFMMIVKTYGGVTAVLLGTTRKAMSIALSFILFPKAFSWMYVAGGACVLGGLTTISLVKQFKKEEHCIQPNEPESCETLPIIEENEESIQQKC